MVSQPLRRGEVLLNMAGLLGGGTVLRRFGTNFWLLRPFASGCREPVPLNPTCTNTESDRGYSAQAAQAACFVCHRRVLSL
jgi:hypothetical protein